MNHNKRCLIILALGVMILKKFIKFIDNIEEYVLVVSLLVTVSLIFLQVIMRYVFSNSLSWTEELARYIFVWQIWLGASLGIKYRKHIRVEFLLGALSGISKKYLEIFVIILWLGMNVFLTINGSGLVDQLLSRNALSPSMRIPLGYIYASVPVGCGLASLRLLQQLYLVVTAKGGEI